MHQRDGVDIETVKARLSNDYALPPSKVKKMSGGWARHPIMGPMYGPAYLQGGRVVKQAVKQHGIEKVARVGLHTNGFVDFQRFQDGVAKKAA